MIELTIGGVAVDVPIGTTLALTWQSNLLGDIKKITGNKSATINLPMTTVNREVFAVAEVPATDGIKARKRLPATLIIDGVKVFDDGYAVLLSVGDTYEVALVWGVVTALTAMADDDTRLNEADWFVWQNYVAGTPGWILLSNTPSPAATQTQIDWRWLSYNTEVEPGDAVNVPPFLPCVRTDYIMAQIASHYGVTFDLPASAWSWMAPLYVMMTTAKTLDGNHGIGVNWSFTTNNYSWQLQSERIPWFKYTHGNTYEYTASMDMSIKVTGRLTGDVPFWISINNTGGDVASTYDGDLGKYVCNYAIEKDMEAGEGFYVYIYTNPYPHSFAAFTMEAIIITVTGAGDAQIIDDGMNRYNLTANLPAMTAVDFVKEITLRCGLFAHKAVGSTVYFVSIADMLSQTPQPLPDPVSVERIAWSWGDYAQKNLLTHTTDDGGDNKGIGTILVNDETLAVESEMFGSRFGLEYNGSWLHLYKHDEPTDPWEYINPAPRLGYRDGMSVRSDGLSWSELINTNLAGWQSLLYEPTVIKARFKMTMLEVVNLSMAKPVHVGRLGRDYAVISITSADGGMFDFELLQI